MWQIPSGFLAGFNISGKERDKKKRMHWHGNVLICRRWVICVKLTGGVREVP